ncbi:MAG: hypothetical protein A2W20_07685 [Candidatus Aminicenantes bacterium RBG_16_66_30]|nr:MAG: hypothetical protein A2W20_07685 [Candidatus Aminicenantes bacterium RBG_16_66_30]
MPSVNDIKDTLRESQEFFRGQERSLAARLAVLPKGRIKADRKGGEIYFYLQYRKGRSVKTDYLGKSVQADLRAKLAERKRLEKELALVREKLKLLRTRREDADFVDPLLSILKALTKEHARDAGLEIIGSWCFLLYQKHFPMERYALKTDDLDILIPRPFKGRAIDLAGSLQRLGFIQHFNADGSTYFSSSGMKVDFLTKAGREGSKPSRPVKGPAVAPQELRYLEILFDEPLVLKVARGVKAKVPAPAAFLLHKLIVATLPERRGKREKDLRQAVYVAKYVLTDRSESDRLRRLWRELPRKWKARVGKALEESRHAVPLEEGVVHRLREVLV